MWVTRRPAGAAEQARALRLSAEMRRVRVERGLTQKAVARSAGISVNTVQKLEQGARHSPEFFTVARICTVLDLSLDQLRERVEEKG